MKNLYNKIDSKKFYENRFAKGYMEEWHVDKKSRVFEVIKNLELPDYGEALDFGCGNGISTIILKEVLPDWDVFGCDISEIAIKNATQRFPHCKFFVNDDAGFKNKKFDFIFSYHVLEHVFDIKILSRQISALAKKDSSMLHILPCGNPGSFEYELCSLRSDGIDRNRENRFYFDDEGHVRRLTTESCSLLFKDYDFVLSKDCYSNQYLGAINWITRSHPRLIFAIFNPFKGKNIKAKVKLSVLLLKFILLSGLRIPVLVYEKIYRKKGILINCLKISLYIPSKLSLYIDKYIVYLSGKE